MACVIQCYSCSHLIVLERVEMGGLLKGMVVERMEVVWSVMEGREGRRVVEEKRNWQEREG